MSVMATCWTLAGERYDIDPSLLRAIAQVESGMDSHAYGYNKNGSRDIGLMQINSLHLKELKRYGITETRLIEEPCVNVLVGAWVLAGFVQRMGYGWDAVGAYNAGSSPERARIRHAYAERVWKHYRKLNHERTVENW